MIKQHKNRLRPVCLLGSVWTWSHWAVCICGSVVSMYAEDDEAAAVSSSKSVNGWSEGMNCFHQTAVDRKTKWIINNCWHICLKGIFNNISTIVIDDQVIDQTYPVHYNCVLLCKIHHLVLFWRKKHLLLFIIFIIFLCLWNDFYRWHKQGCVRGEKLQQIIS